MNKRDLEILETADSIKRALSGLRAMTLGDAADNGYIGKLCESLNALSEMERLFLQVLANR